MSHRWKGVNGTEGSSKGRTFISGEPLGKNQWLIYLHLSPAPTAHLLLIISGSVTAEIFISLPSTTSPVQIIGWLHLLWVKWGNSKNQARFWCKKVISFNAPSLGKSVLPERKHEEFFLSLWGNLFLILENISELPDVWLRCDASQAVDYMFLMTPTLLPGTRWAPAAPQKHNKSGARGCSDANPGGSTDVEGLTYWEGGKKLREGGERPKKEGKTLKNEGGKLKK